MTPISTARTEIVVGMVLLGPLPSAYERAEHAQGSWSLVIERWQIIGRLGWQRVTETWSAP